MRLPKHYGEYRQSKCPFCDKSAMSMNTQGIPVCKLHVGVRLPEVKCTCGSWLDMKKGKWGAFFVCDRCGAISFKKGLDMFKMMSPSDAIQVNKR